jgi:hypothetical protein
MQPSTAIETKLEELGGFARLEKEIQQQQQ